MTIADLETLTRLLTNTTTTSLTAANLLILENKHYERITGRILEMIGGSGTYGDLNYTGFPTLTITMTNSAEAYDFNDWITTTSQQTIARSTPLIILGADVLDNGGVWHLLDRISEDYIRNNLGIALSEYQKTDGRPQEYALRDNLIVLYPAPDNGVSVTLSSGLRLYYLRSGDIFTSAEVTTGTKEPGFPRPWHDLMSYGSAYDYAIANGLRNAAQLKFEYDTRMKEMLDFIAGKDREADNVIRPIFTNFR